jgi:hypothetical protein
MKGKYVYLKIIVCAHISKLLMKFAKSDNSEQTVVRVRL